MSVTHRAVRARALPFLLAAVASIAACDRTVTEPSATARPVDARAAIEGDTLSCTKGWTVIHGRYVCNEL